MLKNLSKQVIVALFVSVVLVGAIFTPVAAQMPNTTCQQPLGTGGTTDCTPRFVLANDSTGGTIAATVDVSKVGGSTVSTATSNAAAVSATGLQANAPVVWGGTSTYNPTAALSALGDGANGSNFPGEGPYVYNGATYDRLRGSVVTGSLNTVNTPGVSTGDALSASIKTSLTTSVNVKASAGNVYGMSVANGAAAICYVQMIDSAGTGTLGTGVIFAIALPVSGTVSIPPGVFALGNFPTGIAVGIASTANTNSACGTAGNITVFYK